METLFLECGGYFSDLRGSFTSSNYPNVYSNNVDCYYYITVPNGYAISMVLKEVHFDATGYDNLMVNIVVNVQCFWVFPNPLFNTGIFLRTISLVSTQLVFNTEII